MKYAIEYEHIKEEFIMTNEYGIDIEWHFNKIKDSANEHSLELSDEEFNGFLKLQSRDKDIEWMMRKMSVHELSFTEALIIYIIY